MEEREDSGRGRQERREEGKQWKWRSKLRKGRTVEEEEKDEERKDNSESGIISGMKGGEWQRTTRTRRGKIN